MPLSILALPNKAPPGSVEKSVVREAAAALETAARQMTNTPVFKRWRCLDSPILWSRLNEMSSSQARRTEPRNGIRSFVVISNHWVGCYQVKDKADPSGSPRCEAKKIERIGMPFLCGLPGFRKLLKTHCQSWPIPTAVSPPRIVLNEDGSAPSDNCAEAVGFVTKASQLPNPCQDTPRVAARQGCMIPPTYAARRQGTQRGEAATKRSAPLPVRIRTQTGVLGRRNVG